LADLHGGVCVPRDGQEAIGDIVQADCLRVLSPIWTEKKEVARKLSQRLGLIFDYAKAHGHRSGDSPMTGFRHGLEKQNAVAAHHPALPFVQIADFITSLRGRSKAGAASRLAVEWLILTATRVGEARFAVWTEIDFTKKAWTIPAVRMKADREHVIPLSDHCMAILEEAKALADDTGLIFPGRKGKPLSENAHNNLIQSLGFKDESGEAITAHGMRSTFRDWAGDPGGSNRDHDLGGVFSSDTTSKAGGSLPGLEVRAKATSACLLPTAPRRDHDSDRDCARFDRLVDGNDVVEFEAGANVDRHLPFLYRIEQVRSIGSEGLQDWSPSMNIDDYEKTGHARFARLAKVVEDILRHALLQSDSLANVPQVQSRAKGPASLRLKLSKRGKLGSDVIEDEIKDLGGCRIIFYTNIDLDRFRSSDFWRANFDVDWQASKTHFPRAEDASVDELYQGIHYVVRRERRKRDFDDPE
jgi:hypothetical protein